MSLTLIDVKILQPFFLDEYFYQIYLWRSSYKNIVLVEQLHL
jgi:hypothetical protein